jgi:glycosyltransferase involved in cell wall biosynthesis
MNRPRVFVAHNYYRRAGGEDTVFRAEVRLLRDRGHAVHEYTTSNEELTTGSLPRAALETIWSARSYRRVRAELEQFGADVAHFHNIFPQLSPSVYFACRDVGVPVVQTLHNYRLVCPQAGMLRQSVPCDLCLKSLHHAVRHSCYRGSVPASAVVGAMLKIHRIAGTWSEAVDRYVVLSDFMRKELSRAVDLPQEKMVVRPNFVDPDPGEGKHEGGYALYVGQLSAAKGVRVLLEAWKLAGSPFGALKMVGEGPLLEEVGEYATRNPGLSVQSTGWLNRAEVNELMRNASVLVFPSLWYECMPMVLLEAFATGLPVIASDSGSMQEMVHHRENGLRFRTGDAGELAAALRSLAESRPDRDRLGSNGRLEFETRYTADRAYESLSAIYESVM